MLSFLRTIRRRLLAGNNFGKYLVYAIGEVILIVIGILIALGINNWNQNRIIREKEQFYLAGLKTEFEQSRAKLEKLIEINRFNYEESQKIADVLTNRDLIPKERQLSELLYNAFRYEIAYNPNNSLLNEMINSGGLQDISNPELRLYLTSWESYVQSVHFQEEALREQRAQVLNIFRTNQGSIRRIFDDLEVSTGEMGLAKSLKNSSNLAILSSTEFENGLLMFILTAIITENSHYHPLLEQINRILELIDLELEKQI